MILAELNLDEERWLLLRLGISLIQPLLVLLLIVGLVVAITHLLTMIGTKWGDYRTTGKSLLLSVGFHFLLACGLISLIPEYRSPVPLSVIVEDGPPIRVLATTDRFAGDSPDGQTARGRSPAESLPRAQPMQESRMESPAERAPDNRAPERAPDFPTFDPNPSPDVSRREIVNRPAPEQAAVPRTELPQAQIPLQANPLQAAAQPDIREPIAPPQRLETSAAPVNPLQPLRPSPDGVVPPNPRISPDLQAANLPLPTAPVAPVQPSENVAEPRRERMILPQIQAPLLGQNSPSPPSTGGPAPDPRLSRADPPSGQSPLANPGMVRSALPNPDGEQRPLLNDSPGFGRDNVLPTPDGPLVRRGDDPFLRRDDQERLPSAYRLRNDQERERALSNYGGTVETEQAVDRALKWLAANQTKAGYWDASAHGAGQAPVSTDGINRENAGATADVGVTALAVLAFLGKLNTVDQGDYSENVTRALKWIIAQQRARDWGQGWGSTDGYLGGPATDFEAMYCHGMATFALAEAYVMSRDNVEAQWLRPPLEKAVNFILQTQIADGGWRYIKGQPEGDMSMFGWQLMALKSAEAAGIPIDPRHRTLMEKFLTTRKLGKGGGLAGYLPREGPTAAMTAEAMYCRQILGIVMEDVAVKEAVAYLLERPPERTSLNLYYWYYGTLAMFQHGGPAWDTWNLAVRDLLVSEQRKQGELAGSWDPRDVWGPYGGRVYSTAIATLSLEVYYRYLPLYRIKEN